MEAVIDFIGLFQFALGAILPVVIGWYVAQMLGVSYASSSFWIYASVLLNELCFAWYGTQLLKRLDPWGRPVGEKESRIAAVIVEGVAMVLVSTIFIRINWEVILAKYPPRRNLGGGFLFVPVITAVAMMLGYIATETIIGHMRTWREQ